MKKFKVYEVVLKIKNKIEQNLEFKNISVVGEISNLKNYVNGSKTTYFFSLKDDRATISCVSFNKHLFEKTNFENGDKVIVTGRISVYERNSKVSLITNKIQKVGLGDLYLQYEKTKVKLRSEGLFNNNRKKTIPTFPEKVGVITAINSAAWTDIKRTIERRSSFKKIIFFDTTVQGPNAKESIIHSLTIADSLNLDVIIMCRGGGSFEDLFCFSEEEVVRKISKLKTPIVTGIGHEIDTSLSDLVSDLSCSTPTAAAEAITFVTDEMIAYIDKIREDLDGRVISKTNNFNQITTKDMQAIKIALDNKLFKISDQINSKENVIKRDLQYKYNNIVRQHSDLENQFQFHRFNLIVKNYLVNQSEKLQSFESNVSYIINRKIADIKTLSHNYINIINEGSPKKILNRGYAIIQNENETSLTTINELTIGQNILIKMQDGNANTEIKNITKNIDE